MATGKGIWPASAALLIISTLTASQAEAQKKRPPSEPQAITAKEKELGAKVHPEILAEFGGNYQSAQTAYVVGVGKNIAVQSGLGNAQSDFTVSFLNSPVNNAFAIPGGYIYITRQLAALCNSEAEMAGVLGHEVGHVAARHSEKRQRSASRAQIAGLLGTVLGAAIGDSGGIAGLLGSGLQRLSGPVAQILTLRYSRKQEEEADDLGIRYLSKAGYDPTALSDMLSSLAMQTSIDARAAGSAARSVPEWASTHPDPAKRVVRAAANAKPYPASNLRKADAHFAAIDNMLYGDDPKQGVVEGQDFLHPDLRLKFTAPTGFGMQNGTRAVTINGSGGQGQFTTAAYSGDRRAYIDAAFKAIGGDRPISYGPISETTVNGLPAFAATASIPAQNGAANILTVFAYEFSRNQAFHFIALTPASAQPFDGMYQSVRRLSANEAAAVKPRKLRIVTVGARDTVATLAQRMAYDSLQEDRFRALNGMTSSAALRPGQKVKIVTY